MTSVLAFCIMFLTKASVKLFHRFKINVYIFEVNSWKSLLSPKKLPRFKLVNVSIIFHGNYCCINFLN